MADNAINHGEVGKESHDLHPAAAEDLGWSPDGRSFLVTGEYHQQQSGIYRIDVKTGERSLLSKSIKAITSLLSPGLRIGTR